MTPEFQPHCEPAPCVHVHCAACRSDAHWRELYAAPAVCPFGVTAATANHQSQVSNLQSTPARGLGDVVAKMTCAVGIKPCGGCKKRQATLNHLFPFKGDAQ